MRTWTLITVTWTLVSRYEGELRCQLCGRRLEVGEEAWRHHAGSSKKPQYYCKGCYRKLWI